MNTKSTVEEIKERFDTDVERFSDLETGQVATIDATISLELITEAAKRITPHAINVLDIGCGAGNYTLKMLSKLPDLNCTLVDLSKPMLDRAYERVSAQAQGSVDIVQGDVREVELKANHFDIILAGAVLHHLRGDEDWVATFAKLYNLLTPGGCLMISDLVTQESETVNEYIRGKYGEYLQSIGGADYSAKVLAYIEKEDSPRSLNYQMDLMKQSGFKYVEVLHKNICFAAFGGVK